MQTTRRSVDPETPAIGSEWWTIAHNPNLGELDGAKGQEPVDFAIWQAVDGMWQLWSCIRGTKCGGMTRLFYRWQSKNLTDKDWRPVGVAMQAKPEFDEEPGYLQAPYVLKIGHLYHMFYGCGNAISLATSKDGITFRRELNANGKSLIFNRERGSRDPMIIRDGNLWRCYYTANPDGKGCVCCRTSKDLAVWSEAKIVALGGQAGTGGNAAECPFVVFRNPYYYLFRTQHYPDNPQTSVYCSKNPLDFGIDDDKYFVCRLPVAAPEIILQEGQYYIAALLPSVKGIRITRLKWV